MKSIVSRVKRGLTVLHRDEQGADMIEYILIVAAVALPMVAVIIWFWKDIAAWAGDAWNNIKGNPQDPGTDPGNLGH